MYAHCEMGGCCCCFNASRDWPCRWFQLLPVTWWMREEKENYHLILDSLLAGIVIYSFSSYTSPIFPFSFFKIFVFERFREMSRKMFGGFDLALSHRLPKSVHGILPFALPRPAILFCFFFFFLFLSFSFFDIWWRVVQSASHAQQFFSWRADGSEWMSESMNEWIKLAHLFPKIPMLISSLPLVSRWAFFKSFRPFRDWTAISSIEKQIVSVFSFIWNFEFLKIKSFKNVGLV